MSAGEAFYVAAFSLSNKLVGEMNRFARRRTDTGFIRVGWHGHRYAAQI